jgi:hypothetical protein
MNASCVTPAQRFTRWRICPVCGGHPAHRSGAGVRCAGFVSSDGAIAHCTREEYAGNLRATNAIPPSYPHRLVGTCSCGQTHDVNNISLFTAQRRPTSARCRTDHPLRHATLGAPSTIYKILAADGSLIATHCRWEREGGGKDCRWHRDGRWTLKPLTVDELPLYGLVDLEKAPTGSKVFVCEGEKAADALRSAGQLAVGTVTGASAIPSDESLRPLLKYTPILWADHDSVGRQHMERIARRLESMGISHQWVQWLDAPPKGDAWDYFAHGGTVGGLDSLVTTTDRPSVRELKRPEHLNRNESPEGVQTIGVLLSEVRPRSIRWLWESRIPMAKLTILDGDPGLGKSLVAEDIGARVTTGHDMPDGSKGMAPAGVVYFTAEDDPADTLLPRGSAANADLTRFLAVQTLSDSREGAGEVIVRLPTLADLDVIRQAVVRVNAKLVIFDPLMAYLHRQTNSFRDQDVRAELTPLAMLAQELDIAVLLIRHLNKGSSANALYRGGGSIGIIGAARSGLMIAKHPDDDARRVLSSQKSNVGPRPADLEYSIRPNQEGAPVVAWHGVSQYSATTLATTYTRAADDSHSALAEACEFLHAELESGPRAEAEIQAEARRMGISRATLQRARTKLKVESTHEGFGPHSRWVWMMNPTLDVAPIDAQPIDAQPEKLEHLCADPQQKRGKEGVSTIDAQSPVYEYLWDLLDERLSPDGHDRTTDQAPFLGALAPGVRAGQCGEWGAL